MILFWLCLKLKTKFVLKNLNWLLFPGACILEIEGRGGNGHEDTHVFMLLPVTLPLPEIPPFWPREPPCVLRGSFSHTSIPHTGILCSAFYSSVYFLTASIKVSSMERWKRVRGMLWTLVVCRQIQNLCPPSQRLRDWQRTWGDDAS